MREQETYMNSINAHANTLKETFVGLSQAFVDTDFVKNALDIGSGALSGLTTFIDKFGTIPTVVGAATLALGLFNKNIGIFSNQNGQFSILGKTVEEIKQAKAEGQAFGGLFTKQVVQPFANADNIINKYNLSLQHNSKTQKGFQSLLDQSDDSLGNYLKNLNGSKASMEGYNKSLKASTISAKGAALATTALNMAVNMIAMAVVSLVITGISKLITYQQDCIDKANELTSAYKEQQKTISDNITNIQSLSA